MFNADFRGVVEGPGMMGILCMVSGRLWKGHQGSWHTVPWMERSIREQLQCQKTWEVTQEQQRTSAD